MRGLLILALVALSVAVSAEAQARCETVPAPLHGQVTVDGRRYAATAGGLLITDVKTGQTQVQSACDGLAGTYLQAIARRHDRALTLAIRGKGLWSLDPLTGAHQALITHPQLRWVTSMAWFSGDLWVGTVQDGLWRIELSGAHPKVTQPVWRFRSKRVTSLAAGPQGGLLVGRDLGGLWRVDASGRSRRLLKGSVQGIEVAQGRVIVARGADRCVLKPKRRCQALPESSSASERPSGELPSDHFTTLLVHPDEVGEARLWAGTFDAGVVIRGPEGQWRRPRAEGLAPRFVNKLASGGGDLWAATATGAFRLRDGQWTRFGEPHGLPSDHVNAVHVAQAGDLWFATSKGLARWSEEGIQTWGTRDGLPYRIVYSVASLQGRVIAGTAYGLGVLEDERWTPFRMGSSALSDDWVNAVAFSPKGVPLVGTYDAGVDSLDSRGPSPVPGMKGLWVNPSGLFPVATHGGTYVATLGDGLWFVPEEGAPRRLDSEQPLPSDDVTAVAVHDGALWIGTRGGLARWPMEGLSAR